MSKTTCLALLSLLAAVGCAGEDFEAAPGPTFVENHPGELTITSPARGAFVPEAKDGRIVVTGTGASDELRVGGEKVSPASDGSFTTTVAATEGLTLIRVVDGEHSIDTPVLYGKFAPATQAVPAAVALRVNALGLDNDDESVLSLTLVAKRALDDVDVLGALNGQKLSGNIPGGSWTFTVKATHYGAVGLHLSPRAGGAHFAATVADIRVDGKLSVEVFGVGPSGDVSITADSAKVVGDVDAGFDGKSAIEASVHSVATTLEGFHYDSNDAGFPCCVDDIMTGFLRPKVQKATQDKVKAALSKSVGVALSQFHLPETIDLARAGFPAKLDVAEQFDGASFDHEGGRITAGVRFHHAEEPTDPGAKAPGWLTVGKPPGEMQTKPAFGVSISLDTLNQALFAAWAQDGLARKVGGVPLAGTISLAPKLPPVVLPNESGGLTAFAGEIVVEAQMSGQPLRAAITIIDDVALSLDPAASALVLTPAAKAVISVTWLEGDELGDSLHQVIEDQIAASLPSLLTPITLPLPSLPLGKIAPSFGDAVGAIAPDAKLAIDAKTSRFAVYGDLTIVGH